MVVTNSYHVFQDQTHALDMTRINVVPPTELSNAHLFAEYREMPRVFLQVIRGVKSEIPEQFTMGKGHQTFFTNKCAWLYDRWNVLRLLLIERGYNLGDTFQVIVKSRARQIRKQHPKCWNQWLPTDEARVLNRQRIAERNL